MSAAAPRSEPQVYELASSLLDMAGFFDTGPLYDAGYSLCDVADRMATTGPGAGRRSRSMCRPCG